VDVKLKLIESFLGLLWIGLRRQQIAAKGNQCPHRIGFVGQDRVIDIAGRHPALPAGANGARFQAQCLGSLRIGQQVLT